MDRLDLMIQERIQSMVQMAKDLLDRRWALHRPALNSRQVDVSHEGFCGFIDELVDRVSSEKKHLTELGQSLDIVRDEFDYYERQMAALENRIEEVDSENK